MIASPTQRTLLHLRRHGALAATVERWNPHVLRPGGGRGIRQDLFGFLDIIAVEPGKVGVSGFQVSRTDDMATREAKIRDAKHWPKAQRWLAAGNRISVVGWAKRGRFSKRWTMAIHELTAFTEADFNLKAVMTPVPFLKIGSAVTTHSGGR